MNWLIVSDGSLLNTRFVEHIHRGADGKIMAQTATAAYTLREISLGRVSALLGLTARAIPPDELRPEPEKQPVPFDYATGKPFEPPAGP